MKKFLRFDEMDLQLFAEGAGGADGGATGSAAAGVTAADAGQQNTGVAAAAAGQQNTGVNEGAAQAVPGAADAGQQDPAETFDSLIKGRYKDDFNASVKKIVDGRVSGLNKQLQSYEAGQPVFDLLAQKYGCDATDYAAIAEHVQKDSSLFEAEALERGVDVQDLMKMRNIEAQNASMRRQMEQQRQQQADIARQQQVEAQQVEWKRQTEETQKVYPGMKLETELANPAFQRLLRSGVPVKAAYEVIHMNEIMGGAMQYAAQRAAKNVTDNVIAGAARPVENGTGAQGAVSAKVDPSKFTDKDMKEYRERIARGERITF